MKLCLSLFLLLAATVASAQQASDAKAVYTKNCAICHGPDGRAQVPAGKSIKAADLTSDAVQKQTDAQLRDALARGKGKMPAYGPALGPKGLDTMVKYIRTLK